MRIPLLIRKLFLREKEQRTDAFAYQRGYDDAEKGRTENPYTRGSVLHASWQKGFKAQRDYELYVW